jgi:ribose-phosphate pyrophosphokinase
MIDGVKTFLAAARTLVESGATRVYLVATHALFSDTGLRALHEEAAVHEVIVTNTIALSTTAPTHKVRIIDLSPVFAESVRRTHNGESISFLFQNVPE